MESRYEWGFSLNDNDATETDAIIMAGKKKKQTNKNVAPEAVSAVRCVATPGKLGLLWYREAC